MAYNFDMNGEDPQPLDPPQDPLAPQKDPTTVPFSQGGTGYDYTTFRNNWLAQAPGTSAQDFLSAHPDFTRGTTLGKGGELFTLPGGETMDAVRDFGPGGANAPTWGDYNYDYNTGQKLNASQAAGQESAWAQANHVAPGGAGGQYAASGSAGAVGGGANVDPELRAALLRLMGRSEPGNIDPLTDPNLAPQARAYSDARQRGSDAERAKLAERASFEGLNSGGAGSGAFTGGLADIYQRQGQDIAGEQAGLVGQEAQSRRSDLMNALQIANAIGARDQSAQIQQQLAGMDNQYKYAALGQNQSQFNDNYGLNLAQLGQNANRDAYLAALGQGY